MRSSMVLRLMALGSLILFSAPQGAISQTVREPVIQTSLWWFHSGWAGTGTVAPFAVPTIALDVGGPVVQDDAPFGSDFARDALRPRSERQRHPAGLAPGGLRH